MALRHVGHPVTRNRGTVCGSLAHADPAAELPAALLALGGHVLARSARGERRIEAAALFRGVLESALAGLTPKLRAAVALHYFHDYDRDDIAAILGIPPGTVASRIAKAMAIMRRRLSAGDQVPDALRSKG